MMVESLGCFREAPFHLNLFEFMSGPAIPKISICNNTIFLALFPNLSICILTTPQSIGVYFYNYSEGVSIFTSFSALIENKFFPQPV